ncbi:MAG: glutathionylspermidine synthase family protein [Acidobacteria bacterium]|nr:glutathionylspermidine synthase family protein [Acidobacteriota bacterium]MBI3426937.1 glutathionylspermidine synthase family protein [Acidobacteriota bacterium]
MTLPTYGEFARQLYATGILSDPWLNGRERFRLQAVILTPERLQALYIAAERVTHIYHELAEIVLAQPELLDDFFGLTPFQKMMWLASEGRWHGIARVDLFVCNDGRIQACELNSDTPSGEAETVLLNQLLHPYHPNTTDPNANFAEHFWQMMQASLVSLPPPLPLSPAVAIIYPTDMPEDLSMIALYRRWLEARGCTVVLGSPYNLGLNAERRVTVLGQPVDLILRHYKTDWWGERETIWDNQTPYPDPDPLARELLLLLAAENEGRVTVVNPFGAVVTQNKLSMALMWERQELFSAQARAWIVEHLPETRRLATLDTEHLPREEWVLKSAYGCEGDSVVVGPFVKPADWRLALTSAIQKHWVAQRYFEVAPLDAVTPLLPNYGVYLLGGRAAGLFTRLSQRATDYASTTAPTFVSGSGFKQEL